MKWSVQRALGLTNEEVMDAEKRAERIERDQVPDGKHEYVPLTLEYSAKNLIGRKTLARLCKGGD